MKVNCTFCGDEFELTKARTFSSVNDSSVSPPYCHWECKRLHDEEKYGKESRLMKTGRFYNKDRLKLKNKGETNESSNPIS